MQVYDTTGDLFAVRRRNDDRGVLIADYLRRLNNRLEQITRAETAHDLRQIGARAAAFVVEAMAREAFHFAKEIAALLKIAPRQARLHDGDQFVDRILLDEGPILENERR